MSTTSPTGASASESPPSQGPRILKGRYEILESIGETERSFLFSGRLVPGDSPIVIKILRDRWVRDREFFERYASELRTIRNLPEHPNILRYIDVDTMAKRFCVISERLEAVGLEARIGETEPLAYPTVLAVMGQLTGLLELGAREGLLSRVIRLEDVLLVESSRTVRLQRFGAPRSPAARSAVSRTAGIASDLLFLGVALFRLFTGGRYPFTGRDDVAEVVADRLAEELKVRYTGISGNEISGVCRLFVGTSSRDLARRMDSYEAVQRSLEELARLNHQVQEERRLSDRAKLLEEDRAERGSAFDAVALLTGKGRPADRAELRDLAAPLEKPDLRSLDLDQEPGGLFSAANVAIAVCALLLLAFIGYLFR